MARQRRQPRGASTQQPGQYGAVQTGQGTGRRLRDVETPQQWELVNDVARAIQVCEWCADQCVRLGDTSMVECIRLCNDVSAIGGTVLTLLPRQSRYAGTVLQAFQQAVQACAQECGRHRHAHCQECAHVLGRAGNSVQTFLGTFEGQGWRDRRPGGAVGRPPARRSPVRHHPVRRRTVTPTPSVHRHPPDGFWPDVARPAPWRPTGARSPDSRTTATARAGSPRAGTGRPPDAHPHRQRAAIRGGGARGD